MGIPELVEVILKYFLDAANSFDKDQKNVFHIAAEHRSGDIYEKLKDSAINKDRMLLDVDNDGNTILHHATKTKIVTKFSLGVANLMAWVVFWFQVCTLYFSITTNSTIIINLLPYTKPVLWSKGELFRKEKAHNLLLT